MTFSNTKSLSDVIAEVMAPRVKQSLQKQAEDQFHPHSETTSEVNPPDHYVTNKLKHKPDDYASADVSSYGQQQRRDLLDQPNIGPIPDKASSDQPSNLSSKDDIPGNHLYDVLDTMATPTGSKAETAPQGPMPSDKLKLKEASYNIQKGIAEIQEQGRVLIDHLLNAVTLSKQASGNPPAAQETTAEAVAASLKLASDDMRGSASMFWADVIDDALYAAEVIAREVKTAEDELTDGTEQVPTGDVGGAEAMGAMTGDELPPEEAEAMLQQSLQENGISPEELGGAPEELGGTPEGGLDDLGAEAGDPAAGFEGDPEEGGLGDDPEAEQFVEALLEAGVTPEELQAAMEELNAEGEQGIAPEAGVLADEEAAKMGSYKFASFVPRRAMKTAEQEARSALIRGTMREFVYGPAHRNFN
jgi:hypothetical protein